MDDHDAQRRAALGAFLRSRRERLSPADVGLADDFGPRARADARLALNGGSGSSGSGSGKPNPRRRTPGLRREEVALLSGVSVSWYSWLEQGRPIAASRQVLDALAATLRLTAAERRHVFELAGESDAGAVQAPAADGCPAVGEHLRATVAALAPVPACLLDLHWDILAYNDAEAALYGGLDHLPSTRRNMIWLYFGWPGMREILKDFEAEAWSVLAQFRASADRNVGDPRFAEILADVTAADPDFPRRWDRHDIAAFTPALKRFIHPRHGPLTFRQTKLIAAENPDLHLLARHPADPSTRRAMDAMEMDAMGMDVTGTEGKR
ncbi:transcriptional regulator with XRE-family HTH domain [Catenulispora sp. MAP5-51]|uniref:helix-turn-helix transcriptional regulator n=1 Tax=Catenulispora sp. MAP5-51 TaxID=3156298 RepID=UPI0035165965